MGVVDAKANMTVISLSLVAAAARVHGKSDASPKRRVILVKNIAQHIVEFFLGVNPGAQSEVARAELQGSGARNLDIRVNAVERAGVEVDAVIDAVIAVAGIVSAIALGLPVADESWFEGALCTVPN